LSVTGAADNWIELLETMLPNILRLVVDVWDDLPKPPVDNKEDAITEALCRALRKSKIGRDLPFYIEIQRIELDPAPGEELGRLDIAFLPTGLPGAPDESIYFCLECKRLNAVVNGKKRPGGSEYVTNGMARFVSGQYANAVRHGGMLGYVLDGDIAGATANVESNVSGQHVSLRMEPPGVLQSSSVIAETPTVRESRHSRAGQSVKFCIHHLFVDALTQAD
jgi:hypothetical protein